MADLRTRLGDLELRTPLVLASGPLSHDGAALVRAHRAGAGAVVTKTISEVTRRKPSQSRSAVPAPTRSKSARTMGRRLSRWSAPPCAAPQFRFSPM